MNRYLNSTQLVESAKRRAMLPENQPTFTEQDFLDFATEEMDAAIIPYVMSYHEDYFLVSEDIPITSGVDKYAIPYRAVGNKLRDIQWVDSSGNPYEMTRIGEGDEPYFNWGRSILRPFYIKGNQAVLPRNSYNYAGGNLRFIYYIRPNRLVTEDRVATITGIAAPSGGTVTISVASTPEVFSSGKLLDFIQTKSPHKCLGIDIPNAVVDAGLNTITIDEDYLPTGLAVGDYIALAEECIIPQIPTDLHSMLAQRIACRCLEALGDQAGLQAANAKLAEMEQKLATVVDSRVEDAPMKVNARHTFLRANRRYRRFLGF